MGLIYRELLEHKDHEKRFVLLMGNTMCKEN